MAVGFSFWPHLFQKAYAARSERVLWRTVVLYPTFQFFLLPILLIVFAAAADPLPAQADQVLPHMLLELELPAVVVGFLRWPGRPCPAVAILHSAASILVRDGWIGGGSLSQRPSAPPSGPCSSRSSRPTSRRRPSTPTSWAPRLRLRTLGQLAPPSWPRSSGAAPPGPPPRGPGPGPAVTLGLPHLVALDVHPGVPGLAVNALVVVLGSLAFPRR